MAGKETTMEKELTTKEKIIFESLKLFSRKGYDGVSMREIASAVGIKGASIYNHFSGKEEIFKAILDEMGKRYEASAVSMNIPVEQEDKELEFYSYIDEESLLLVVEKMFEFFCLDDFASLFLRLLTCEQYKSDTVANMLKQFYFEAPVQYQKKIFENMQKNGSMKSFAPEVMALHFYSPIYYVLCEFDLGYDYEKCLQMLKNHVKTFCSLYVKNV